MKLLHGQTTIHVGRMEIDGYSSLFPNMRAKSNVIVIAEK